MPGQRGDADEVIVVEASNFVGAHASIDSDHEEAEAAYCRSLVEDHRDACEGSPLTAAGSDADAEAAEPPPGP
eukprot:14221683-Alexandrium_andersonii.AAC.1